MTCGSSCCSLANWSSTPSPVDPASRPNVRGGIELPTLPKNTDTKQLYSAPSFVQMPTVTGQSDTPLHPFPGCRTARLDEEDEPRHPSAEPRPAIAFRALAPDGLSLAGVRRPLPADTLTDTPLRGSAYGLLSDTLRSVSTNQPLAERVGR